MCPQTPADPKLDIFYISHRAPIEPKRRSTGSQGSKKLSGVCFRVGSSKLCASTFRNELGCTKKTKDTSDSNLRLVMLALKLQLKSCSLRSSS